MGQSDNSQVRRVLNSNVRTKLLHAAVVRAAAASGRDDTKQQAITGLTQHAQQHTKSKKHKPIITITLKFLRRNSIGILHQNDPRK